MSYTSIWTISFYLPEQHDFGSCLQEKPQKHFRQLLVRVLGKSLGLVNWLPRVENLILRIKSSQTARYYKLQLQPHFSSSKKTIHISNTHKQLFSHTLQINAVNFQRIYFFLHTESISAQFLNTKMAKYEIKYYCMNQLSSHQLMPLKVILGSVIVSQGK